MNLKYTKDSVGRPYVECGGCGIRVSLRYTEAACGGEYLGFVMIVGMDRPVHKCPMMPRHVEVTIMQEISKIVKDTNVNLGGIAGYGPVLRSEGAAMRYPRVKLPEPYDVILHQPDLLGIDVTPWSAVVDAEATLATRQTDA